MPLDDDDAEFWSSIPKTFIYRLANALLFVIFDEYDRASTMSVTIPKSQQAKVLE